MKKIIFAAMIAIGFASCTAETEGTPSNDSTVTATDSTACDSTCVKSDSVITK